MKETNGRMGDIPDNLEEPHVPRKPYSAPRLVVYGDLRLIAQTRRKSGADGGSGGSAFSK